MPQYFAIIGKRDNPVYEIEFTNAQNPHGFPQDLKELNPFILHASLDIVEDLQWQINPASHLGNGGNGANGSNGGGGFLRSRTVSNTDNCYLGKVDHFYGLAITCLLYTSRCV